MSQITTKASENELLSAALFYASRGWPVIPLTENQKTPIPGSSGYKDGSTDEAQIRAWFESYPNRNIGIVTGAASGLTVMDIDPRSGGNETWFEFQKEHGIVPDTVTQLTGGGGFHYLLAYDPRIPKTKLRNGDGVDVLSGGGYIVAHPSVVAGKRYEWEGSSDPFDGVAAMPVPEKWVDVIGEKPKVKLEVIEGGSSEASPIGAGGRNNALTALAGALRRYGLDANAIEAALSETNNARCTPPLPGSEVRQIVNSVCRYNVVSDIAGINGQLVAEVDAGDDWVALGKSKSAPLRYLVKRWIPRNSVGFLFGPSGAGKSYVAIDLMMRVASGASEWNGAKVRQGSVLYLAGEGHSGIHSRVDAWMQTHGINQEMPILMAQSSTLLDREGEIDKIIARCNRREFKPDLVVIDTLHNHLSGDESNSKDIAAFNLQVKRLKDALGGAAILIVHHVGLADGAQERARGSSSLKGLADFEICLKRTDEAVEVFSTKTKDGRPPEPIAFTFKEVEILDETGNVIYDEDGDAFVSAIIVPAEAKPASVGLSKTNAARADAAFDKAKHIFIAACDLEAAKVKAAGLPWDVRQGVDPDTTMKEALLAAYLRLHEGDGRSMEERMAGSKQWIRDRMKPGGNASILRILRDEGLIEVSDKAWIPVNDAFIMDCQTADFS